MSEETALTVTSEQEKQVLAAMGASGVDYDREMDDQNDQIVPSLPQVKSLKEYKNFVYEIGVDELGEPNRLELSDVMGIVAFYHPMRAIFYEEKSCGMIWQLFPGLKDDEVLRNYNPRMPLCSAFVGMPNREFKFAARCDTCPLNSFGSPCKPKERLFLKMNAEIADTEKPLIDCVTFTLPVTSLKWWNGKNGYLAELKAAKSKMLPRGIPVSAIWTEFTRKFVSNNGYKYHEIHFKRAGIPVSKEDAKFVRDWRDEIKRSFMKMVDVDYAGPSGDDAPFPAP